MSIVVHHRMYTYDGFVDDDDAVVAVVDEVGNDMTLDLIARISASGAFL
jgi:hypothetical protein